MKKIYFISISRCSPPSRSLSPSSRRDSRARPSHRLGALSCPFSFLARLSTLSPAVEKDYARPFKHDRDRLGARCELVEAGQGCRQVDLVGRVALVRPLGKVASFLRRLVLEALPQTTRARQSPSEPDLDPGCAEGPQDERREGPDEEADRRARAGLSRDVQALGPGRREGWQRRGEVQLVEL